MSKNITKSLIVDGNNLLFRVSYVPLAPVMHNNINVAPVAHFVRMVTKYLTDFGCDDAYVVWDKKLNTSEDRVFFRKTLLGDAYKANRDKEKHVHIFEAMDAINDLLSAMGVKILYPYNLEADDIIAWLVRNHCNSSVIVSSDSDLLQLVTPSVSVHSPSAKVTVTPANFNTVAKTTQQDFILRKCIIGDMSDNIKGIDGIGPVRVIKMLEAGIDSLTESQRAIVDRNMQIIDLKYGPIYSPEDVESYKTQITDQSGVRYDAAQFTAACARNGTPDLMSSTLKTAMSTALTRNQRAQTLVDMFNSLN